MERSKRKYKTSLCRHYELGSCSLMSRCHFAHGAAELRREEDPLPEMLPSPVQHEEIERHKTQLCRYFQRGACRKGESCTFAHGIEDMLGQLNPNGIETEQEMPLLSERPVPPVPQPVGSNRQEQFIFMLIISSMKKMFKENPEALEELEFAEKNMREGKLATASEVINSLMGDQRRTEKEQEGYRKIRTNAQILYLNQMFQFQ